MPVFHVHFLAFAYSVKRIRNPQGYIGRYAGKKNILDVLEKEKGNVTGVLDIHSHVLPGLDDGAASEEEALKMLREARRQGIREVIATPHFGRPFPNNCPDRIRNMCADLQEKAEQKKIRIKIYPGQEIMYSEEIPGMLSRGELLTLADSRFVLVEFHFGVAYSEVLRAVRMLMIEGYSPVLAHVERYKDLRREDRIEELLAQGAYLQINFSSAGGKWYSETTRWSRTLLSREHVHFMGTDMHNMTSRKPVTEEAVRWMEKKLDSAYMKRLLRGNAKRMIMNEKRKRKGK